MSDIVERLRAFVAIEGGDIADVERAADEIERLRAEVETLRRDAERYRWLRDDEDAHAVYSAFYFNTDTAADFDDRIDAAMKEPE